MIDQLIQGINDFARYIIPLLLVGIPCYGLVFKKVKVYELFVNHKDDENFRKISTKTLIMTGENDIGSTPDMSNNLSKEIANSKVKIISKGKHLCGIECADDVNMEIKKFIDNA